MRTGEDDDLTVQLASTHEAHILHARIKGKAFKCPGISICPYFFGGAALTNAIPHFVSGTMGHPFQSPFASPPGKGLSSSTVNVLWGAFNVVIGYVLLCRAGDFDLHNTGSALAAGLGALLMGVMLARTFGRLHGGISPGK